jgi:hypothetical protein
VIWSLHAARQVLKRRLDPSRVQALAEAHQDLVGVGRPSRVRIGDLVLVMAGTNRGVVLVTVFVEGEASDARKARLFRRKRRRRQEAERLR